jgi:hypothetical protein
MRRKGEDRAQLTATIFSGRAQAAQLAVIDGAPGLVWATPVDCGERPAYLAAEAGAHSTRTSFWPGTSSARSPNDAGSPPENQVTG